MGGAAGAGERVERPGRRRGGMVGVEKGHACRVEAMVGVGREHGRVGNQLVGRGVVSVLKGGGVEIVVVCSEWQVSILMIEGSRRPKCLIVIINSSTKDVICAVLEGKKKTLYTDMLPGIARPTD